MKKVNVFICHNPFHLYISRQICSGKFFSGDYENIFFTSVKGNKNGNGIKFIETGQSALEKIKMLWSAKQTLKKLARKFKSNMEVFLPHTDGIIGNFCFESPVLRENGVPINLYYEGIVMLDEERMKRNFPRFILQKKLLSLLALHRFVKHDDILPMNSSRIAKIYTPYLDKTPAPQAKKVEIAFQKEHMLRAHGTLIVGVDAGERLEQSYISMIKFLRRDSINNIFFFKPHYADKQFIFQKLAAQDQFEYKLVQDTRCIEELIGELGVKEVICTHLSSALLNLKMIYKNDLRVILFAHDNTLQALGSKNISLAKELSIEILNVTNYERV